MKFKSETEIIGTLQCAGISYSIAVLLNRMVKEKWETSASEYLKLGVGQLFTSVYKFHHVEE